MTTQALSLGRREQGKDALPTVAAGDFGESLALAIAQRPIGACAKRDQRNSSSSVM